MPGTVGRESDFSGRAANFLTTALKLIRSGHYHNPLDAPPLNPYHEGEMSFREMFGTVCSTHITINFQTGGVTSHKDTVNPLPAWPLLFGPVAFGLYTYTTAAHAVADVAGAVPASMVCK